MCLLEDSFRDVVQRNTPGEFTRVKAHKVDAVGVVSEEGRTLHLLSACDYLLVLVELLDVDVVHVCYGVVSQL